MENASQPDIAVILHSSTLTIWLQVPGKDCCWPGLYPFSTFSVTEPWFNCRWQWTRPKDVYQLPLLKQKISSHWVGIPGKFLKGNRQLPFMPFPPSMEFLLWIWLGLQQPQWTKQRSIPSPGIWTGIIAGYALLEQPPRGRTTNFCYPFQPPPDVVHPFWSVLAGKVVGWK